jgi:bacteriorhodopsin
MLNFENLFSYTPMAYDMVSHVLTLGYAVMLAALFYFILTMKTAAPKYRMSSVLSVVVMVSAFLLLLVQQTNWTAAFQFNPATGLYERIANADGFTNGYRYLNWLIDVPMLLFQILFVVTISQASFRSYRNQFFISGPLMILTGYVGQFYESSDTSLLLIWGTISTLFFIHVLYLIYKIISEAKSDMPEEAAKIMTGIWWLFLFAWMLYPGAYLMPLYIDGEMGVVGRQITYTVADILSKVIYGVLLTQVAMLRSKAEGYEFS